MTNTKSHLTRTKKEKQKAEMHLDTASCVTAHKVQVNMVDGLDERMAILERHMIKEISDFLKEREEYPRFYKEMAYFGMTDNEIQRAWAKRKG